LVNKSVLCRIVPTDSVPETDKFCLWGPNKINIRSKVIIFLIKIMQTTLFLKTFLESSSRLYTTSYRRDLQTKFKLVRYLCGTEPEGTILHDKKKMKMNFSLTFVMLVLLALAKAAPEPKTYVVETADEMPYRRQGAIADEALADLGPDYEGNGSGDDYWWYGNQMLQNFNINNGRK